MAHHVLTKLTSKMPKNEKMEEHKPKEKMKDKKKKGC